MSNKIISVNNPIAAVFDHFELLPHGLQIAKNGGLLSPDHLKWKKRTTSHLYKDEGKEGFNPTLSQQTQIIVGALSKINGKPKLKDIANKSSACGEGECVIMGGRKRRRSRRKSRRGGKKRNPRRKRRKSRKKRKRRTRRRRRR